MCAESRPWPNEDDLQVQWLRSPSQQESFTLPLWSSAPTKRSAVIKDTHKHTHAHKGSSTTQDFSALTFPGHTASIKTSWLPCKVMKVDFTNLTVIASSASVSDTWWFLDLYPFADAAVYWHCVGRSRQRWDQGFALLNKKYKNKKKVVDINTEGAHGGTDCQLLLTPVRWVG